jgi:hypothetical protein
MNFFAFFGAPQAAGSYRKLEFDTLPWLVKLLFFYRKEVVKTGNMSLTNRFCKVYVADRQHFVTG